MRSPKQTLTPREEMIFESLREEVRGVHKEMEQLVRARGLEHNLSYRESGAVESVMAISLVKLLMRAEGAELRIAKLEEAMELLGVAT